MPAHEPGPNRSLLVAVYGALLALLVLTAILAFLPLGGFAVPAALLVASVKVALIFLYFMRLRYQRGLVRLFAVSGFYWLAIIGLLTFADYLTRGE